MSTAEVAQQIVERLSLRQRTREAVEHETRQRVAAVEPVGDQADHQIVGDKIAAVVDLFQLPSRRGRKLLHLADHVAGRDVWNPIGGRQAFRLRSLAGSLRSEKEDVQRRKPS